MDQKAENEIIGDSEQTKIDQKLNENLAFPTKDEILKQLVKEGLELDVDPKILGILKKEEK